MDDMAEEMLFLTAERQEPSKIYKEYSRELAYNSEEFRSNQQNIEKKIERIKTELTQNSDISGKKKGLL